MTRKQWNIVAGALLAVGLIAVVCPLGTALPWIIFPLKAYDPLTYPNGVTFHQTSDQQFPKVTWSADDWDRPGPCPLVIHLPTGDLDATHLGSLDQLRNDGWTEEVAGLGINLSSPGQVVECHFRNRALTHITVNAEAETSNVHIAVSYHGRRVLLPATADTIIAALGAPSNR
jgi:hypothetical protein